MDEAVYTEIFAHHDQVMTAEARNRDDGWELAIRDGDGQVRCGWRPDPALMAGDADRMMTTVLQMMVSMVRSGLLPLDARGPSALAQGWTSGQSMPGLPGSRS